jgi:hypothetical protein
LDNQNGIESGSKRLGGREEKITPAANKYLLSLERQRKYLRKSLGNSVLCLANAQTKKSGRGIN